MTFEYPGIFFTNTTSVYQNTKPASCGLVARYGTLSSTFRSEKVTVHLDGLLINADNSGRSDVQYIHDLFLKERDPGHIARLNGFFNILLEDHQSGDLYFLSDVLCSRPWYYYSKDGHIMFSPSPVSAAEHHLPMSMNRESMYDMIRFLNTLGERTLVNEIFRVKPGTGYRISKDHDFSSFSTFDFDQNLNREITLQESVDWVKDQVHDAIHSVLHHPVLQTLPVHLPLTGGLDSRQILGELIQQGRTPEVIRHINIKPDELEAAAKISDALHIPFEAPNIEDLDHPKLINRWMQRSGGLMNIHQSYLLHLGQRDKNGTSTLAFEGYLMDKFLGIAPRGKPANDSEAISNYMGRNYTAQSIRKKLFDNASDLETSVEHRITEAYHNINGQPFYKMMMLDMHNRGMHYAGGFDTMLADETHCFSPGATIESIRFAQSVPRDLAGDKQAKLDVFKQYFPDIARYPDSDGISLLDIGKKPKVVKNPLISNALPLFKSVMTGMKKDPAPNTEHQWIRKHKHYHHIHKRFVEDSALAQDGYLNNSGLKHSWRLHQLGGYQAWTLMSALTVEVAYRLLVKQEAVRDVYTWLFDGIEE